MIRPSVEVLEAIIRLRNDEDFKIFFGWLNENYIQGAIAGNKVVTEPQRSWKNGHVQMTEYLLDTIRAADQQLEKARRGDNQGG